MGIGSEAYEAIRLGRRAIGIELKPSYYRIAVENLSKIEMLSTGPTLLNWQDFQ
jgi:DNA modification methylase